MSAVYRNGKRIEATITEHQRAYARNYERIAADHLAAADETGANPWQPAACVIANTSVSAGVIRDLTPPGSAILDIGCGPGDLLATLPEYDRHGIDISDAYISLACEKGLKAIVGNAEALPYADGTFDTVVCADVLEHVLNLHAAVSEALRVLKPAGVLVVRVPHEDDLTPYLTSEYEFVHLRRFDQATLQLLFGRVFVTTVLLMFEMTVATEGTLAREIVCAVRKPA